MFKIEKRKPLPPKYNEKQNKYPFREMNIGDSFVISETYSREGMQLYSGAARSWNAKCNGGKWKFAARKVIEGGKTKIRIWRIQ